MSGLMWAAWVAMAGFTGAYGWAWKKTGASGRKWLEWGLAALEDGGRGEADGADADDGGGFHGTPAEGWRE